MFFKYVSETEGEIGLQGLLRKTASFNREQSGVSRDFLGPLLFSCLYIIQDWLLSSYLVWKVLGDSVLSSCKHTSPGCFIHCVFFKL